MTATSAFNFFKDLPAVGLVSFTRRIRARVAPFFVTKKNGDLRLVIDGKEPSALHRRPPYTPLGSAAAISAVDMSSTTVSRASSLSNAPDSESFFGANADLRQGFYQLTWIEMCEWFGFDCPEEAHVYGATYSYCCRKRLWGPLDPNTRVYPVFSGLAAVGAGRCISATL